MENTSEQEADTENLAGELEKTFLGQVVNKPMQGAEGKKSKKYPPKDCPLKCGRRRPNRSTFCCRVFRSKTIDERKALCRNINLCILCLAVKNKTHTCVVQSCPRCFASHNTLLCPQENEDGLLATQEKR